MRECRGSGLASPCGLDIAVVRVTVLESSPGQPGKRGGTMAAHESQEAKDMSLIEPRSAPPGHATPENIKTDAKTVGKASGGTLGAATGMALGVAAGPVGLVLGGIAGAVGGWWAGRGVANAITDDDDAAYRTH